MNVSERIRGKKQKGGGGEKRRLEEAKKENFPRVRSALVRTYSKNTVRDTSLKTFKRNKLSRN